MRAALYVRAASFDQMAFDARLAHLRKYTEEHNYEVATIFALNGVSGMETNEWMTFCVLPEQSM